MEQNIRDAQDRLYSKKWGIFYHFLGGDDAEAWNLRVKNADVERWAAQAAELGAGFFGITLMQVYRTMLAPNETYDRITGYRPGEACPERDLVLDLSDALRKYGIDLLLYYTGDGPCRDSSRKASDAFGFPEWELDENGNRIERPDKGVSFSFVEKWSKVLKEYSVRYGDRVLAWWIDGCYDGQPVTSTHYGDWQTPGFYSKDKEAKLQYYKDAVRAGNPSTLIAFNGGCHERVREHHSRLDDFTAGEMSFLYDRCDSRFVDGAQWFEFLCNGFWYKDRVYTETETQFTPEFLYDYVSGIRANGGVVMFDTKFSLDGTIDPGQFHTMSKLRELK